MPSMFSFILYSTKTVNISNFILQDIKYTVNEKINNYEFRLNKSTSLFAHVFQFSNDNYYFICFGDFYCSINEKYFQTLFNKYQPEQFLINILNEFTGSFSGIYFDKKKNEIFAFCDFLGFNKIYFCKFGDSILMCSSIWPICELMRQNNTLEFDQSSIRDFILLGYPLGEKMFFKNIGLIQPGCIYKFSSEGQLFKKFDYLRLKEESSKTAAEDFYSIVDEIVSYFTIRKKCEIHCTLTGGTDTRLILNTLLQKGIKPYCVVGYHNKSEKDLKRAIKISKYFSLGLQTVKYTTDDEKLINEIITMSNGYVSGSDMAILCDSIKSNNSIVISGVSANLVSGDFKLLSSLNLEQIARENFNSDFIMDYQIPVDPSILLTGTTSKFEEFLSEYLDSYKIYPSLRQTLYHQRRNERNFKRIGAYAEGFKYCISYLLFFHDRRIIQLYYSLDDKLFFNQKYHKMLSYYKQPYFALLPSTTFPVPNYFGHLLESVVPRSFINYAKIIKRKAKFNNQLDSSITDKFFNEHNILWANNIIDLEEIAKNSKLLSLPAPILNQFFNRVSNLIKINEKAFGRR